LVGWFIHSLSVFEIGIGKATNRPNKQTMNTVRFMFRNGGVQYSVSNDQVTGNKPFKVTKQGQNTYVFEGKQQNSFIFSSNNNNSVGSIGGSWLNWFGMNSNHTSFSMNNAVISGNSRINVGNNNNGFSFNGGEVIINGVRYAPVQDKAKDGSSSSTSTDVTSTPKEEDEYITAWPFPNKMGNIASICVSEATQVNVLKKAPMHSNLALRSSEASKLNLTVHGSFQNLDATASEASHIKFHLNNKTIHFSNIKARSSEASKIEGLVATDTISMDASEASKINFVLSKNETTGKQATILKMRSTEASSCTQYRLHHK